MKKFLILLCLVLFFQFSIASKTLASLTLVTQGDTWNYSVLSTDLWPSWNTVGYSSFDWDHATWTSGNAAFGNPYSLPYSTEWTANTDLALVKSVSIGVPLTEATLKVASDNGFDIFINGQQVAKANAEGYTSYWEYTYDLDPSVFSVGMNTVSVLAEDHGGATFFDMQLTGEAVPIPSTCLLFLSGLLGMVGIKRKVWKA